MNQEDFYEAITLTNFVENCQDLPYLKNEGISHLVSKNK